jgi:hypothetical protein
LAAISFDHADDARNALHAIVSDPAHGRDALSSPQTMSNLLQDLLPDAPRETSLLMAAANVGVPAALREHVSLGMDVETAIGLVAATLAARTAFPPEACAWVATELAVALGLASPDVHIVMPTADEADAGSAGATDDPGQTQAGRADLAQADLAQADLAQADLTQADLAQADLTQASPVQAATPTAQVTSDAWRRALGTDSADGVDRAGPTTPVIAPQPVQPRDRRIVPAAVLGGCIVVAGAVVAAAVFLGPHSHNSSPQGPGSTGSLPPSHGVSTPPSSTTPATGYHLTATLDPGTAGSMTQVAWTPDNSVVATSDKNGSAYLWNPATGSQVGRFAAPGAGRALAMAISPDGSMLAIGYSNGTTYLWKIASKKLIATLPDGGPYTSAREVDSVAFSPDGNTLVSADGNGNAFVWRVSSAHPSSTPVRSLADPAGAGVWSAAFSSDGTLATGDYAGNIYLWNVGSGSYSGPLVIPGGVYVTALAFSPDGRVLAAGSESGSAGGVYLFNTSTQAGQNLTNPGPVWALAFDGSVLAAADGDGRTYLFDVNAGSLNATTVQTLADPNSGSQGVGAMDFSPSGKWLVTGDTNGRAYLWSSG